MKTFPMFLKTDSRRIVVMGGGETAAQKVRLALKTSAEIVVVTDAPDAEISALAEAGKLSVQPYSAGVFDQAILVFVATGCKGADGALAALAKSHGVLVNVVDYPELCDAFTPSIVDRSPVVVAIGTEGTAPVLGRQIKTRIEELLEPRLGELAAVCGRLRKSVAEQVAAPQRRDFWRWVFSNAPRKLFAQGNERAAITLIKSVIAQRGLPAERGLLTMMDVCNAQSDLLTLRAVNRLQNADIIIHEPQCDASILELARRDAARVVVQGTGEQALAQVQEHSNVVWLVDRLSANAAQSFARQRQSGLTETLPKVAV